MDNQIQPQLIINPSKSVAASLLFALLLGPLGLLYASVKGSIIMFILFLLLIGIQKVGPGLGLIIWIVSIYWAVIAANKRNKKMFIKLGICPQNPSK